MGWIMNCRITYSQHSQHALLMFIDKLNRMAFGITNERRHCLGIFHSQFPTHTRCQCQIVYYIGFLGCASIHAFSINILRFSTNSKVFHKFIFVFRLLSNCGNNYYSCIWWPLEWINSSYINFHSLFDIFSWIAWPKLPACMVCMHRSHSGPNPSEIHVITKRFVGDVLQFSAQPTSFAIV